ncbi:MAG: ATP-binding protein, partial [Dehalococcoidia bacterium]
MSDLSLRSTANALVGRQPEIKALGARLDESLSGHGGVSLLAGEPGIGKTRLLEEMTAVAEARGACVLWGRCYEGEGAPAFWPWIQILRAAVRDSPAAFVEPLGPGASDLAQLIPEIQAQRAAEPHAAPPPAADPVQARFRLFDAVTAVVGRRAATRPQVLILDDLHWADASSLLLLQFIARSVQAMPLLVLGAYRDAEIDPEHPLTATLAALSRERGYERRVLHGVPPDAVAALLADACGTDRVALSIIQELHELTAGNPLFIRETLRHLIETGRLTTQDGAESEEAPALTAIEAPEGVRWVLRQRLARLPENAAQVLSIAAVIGHEFDIATLASALESDGLPVMETLDAAEAARLVTTVPDGGAGAVLRYRFEHDLIRATLQGDLSRATRVRLHHRVGEALEDRWRIDPDAHLSELA